MREGQKVALGVLGVAMIAIGASAAYRQTILPNVVGTDGSTMLPNGWRIAPVGKILALPGDMPTKMAWSADGKTLYVLTSGWHNQGIDVIDPNTFELKQTVELGNTFAGIAQVNDSIYVAGGLKPVRTVSVKDGVLEKSDPLELELQKGAWTTGLASVNDRLYVLDENHAGIFLVDLATKKILTEGKTGYHPYGVFPSNSGSEIAVSNWGDESVSFLDPLTLLEKSRIKVGSHPNEMVWAKDGRLFVVCSGDNTVQVIQHGKVVERVKTSLDPKDRVGSTPIAIALSPDQKTLYVANADNNDVAVIDVSEKESEVKGFIPTGWYPSALTVSPDGKQLYIATGKGMKFSPNAEKQPLITGKPKYKYIPSLLQGHVASIPVPTEAELAKYTKQVLANVPNRQVLLSASDKKKIDETLKKIKHVVYIIRENRTYDQVFGDMSRGNNEPSLVMFGEEVTPNAHALASTFVQLDNTYCNGEVSEDGHQWCNAAYATDFTEKAWISSYSGREEPNGDTRLTASPAGYLWDVCEKAKKSYYSYGEFASFKSSPTTVPTYTGTPGLEGHASLEWTKFNRTKDDGRDHQKIDVFIDDLKKAEKTGKWYDYMVMSLGEDHTSGLKAGLFTPRACVASNDFALGKLVDAVSHSKFWKDTAIFVIEDDAQNGPDHVDAHRTVALVISPYTVRGVLDSTFYTTSSMVRTMELILGLSPMTQYDEHATPMLATFATKPDFTPFTCLPPKIDITTRNPQKGALVELSNKLDWSEFDKADPDTLNYILWKSLKPGQAMPAPVRRARLGR